MEEKVHDCIIVGAGPGGLQAAIYLGRFNRGVLLLDRGGGRTYHARYIENFLTQKIISGKEIIETGIEQARSFKVTVQRNNTVTKILKESLFEVFTKEDKHISKFIVVSTGGQENLPAIDNIHKFFGSSFFTCVDCDGYRTTGKKLVVIGNSIHTVRLALAMKEMYTEDITLVLYFFEPPGDFQELLKEEGVSLIKGRPIRIVGSERIEAVELQDGRRLDCEVVMSDFGFKLNDDFLSGLPLKKDASGRYIVNHNFESSLDGLYIVGPLNSGDDQAIIAAGEGATAAIDINKRLLNM